MLGRAKQLLSIISAPLSRLSARGVFGAPNKPVVTLASDPTIVLGGGIIGLSTAFYLSDSIPNDIVVIDSAPDVCAGASGQCEGALGDFGVEKELIPINSLSFDLHRKLAADFNGEDHYGFSGLDVHTVFSERYDPDNPKLPFPVQGPESLSDLPRWLNVSDKWHAALISNQSHAARLDPPRFCRFLRDECTRRGVKFLFNTNPLSLHLDQTQEGPNQLQVSHSETSQILQIPWRNLVISAGSWSGRLFSTLFPDAQIHIPLIENQPTQNWMRIRTPHWKEEDDKEGCHQVWLDPIMNNMSLHLSTFIGGEMYLANDIVPTSGELPELPNDLKPQPESIDAMMLEATKHLVLGKGESLEVVSKGRAYLPQLDSKLPIIAKVPWKDLSQTTVVDRVEQSQQILQSTLDSSKKTVGGVFLNVGHYLDGFVIGPGSGKVMSELILGKKTSVDTSPFDLPKTARRTHD